MLMGKPMILIMNNIDASNIISLPLAFVRSGYVSTNSGGVYSIGEKGYGWSGVAGLTPTAYGLALSPTGIDTSSNYNGRWYGFSLRCHPYQPIIKPLLFLLFTIFL